MRLHIAPSKKQTKLPAILEAAVKLFVERGIDGTSIRDISRAAGVAEGALYRHFKSKEDLAWHLFSENLKGFTEELLGKVLAVKDARRRIAVFTEECFTACEKDRALFYFLILSEHRELAKYTREYLHPGKVIEQVISEGQARGEIRKDEPWLVFSQVFGPVHRMCILRAWGLVKKPLPQLAASTAEAVWQAVKK